MADDVTEEIQSVEECDKVIDEHDVTMTSPPPL